MESLDRKFRHFFDQQGIDGVGSRVVVAVSGGLDSVVMAHLFKKHFKGEWVIAHVNHGLRGAEADADEYFAAELAARNGVRFFSYKCSVRQHASERKQSLEEAGREKRLSWLDTVRRHLAFDFVALAHQADDQCETVLMHLLQGSGLRGLAGIRAKRGVFIRPLLTVSRAALARYAEEADFFHREDASNTDHQFLRNRIRRNLVPVCKDVMKQDIAPAVNRSARWIREVLMDLESMTDDAWKEAVTLSHGGEIDLDIRKFFNYFTSIQKSLLIRIFEYMLGAGFYPRAKALDRLLKFVLSGSHGQTLKVLNVGVVHSENGVIFCPVRQSLVKRTVEADDRVVLKEAGLVFASKLLPPAPMPPIPRERNRALLALPSEGARLEIRAMESGDRFMPLGMKHMKKVSHFFVDEKVTRWRRPVIPLLTVNGEIAWIAGYRIDERFKATSHATCFIEVTVEALDPKFTATFEKE